MFYFLHGTDTDKAREKAHELLASMQKKKPTAELFRLDSDNWSSGKLTELAESQGLFERKFIVFANRLLENTEAKEVVLKMLAEIKESENVFIFLEGKIDKASLTEITDCAEKVQAFEKKSNRCNIKLLCLIT